MSSEERGNGFIKFDPDLPDENHGTALFVLCVLFSVLIILSTVSRLAMKLIMRLGLSAADCFMLITLAFNLTGNLLEIQMLKAGFGRHLQYIDRPDVLFLKRISQYLILMANIALWSVKVSISLFVLNLIRGTHVIMARILYGLIAVTTAASLGQGIFWGLQARPLQKLWNPDIPGTVQSIDTLVRSIIIFTCINSVTDLFYALSPIYFFGKLKMDLKKRIVLIALTGSGLLVFASSIVRVAFDGDFYDPDFTWALHRVYLCTVIERNVAEIIADLPATFTIMRSLRQKSSTLISSRYGRITAAANSSGSHNRKQDGSGGNSHADSKQWRSVTSNSFPFRGVVETQAEADEVPLRDSPHVQGDNSRNIRLETSINISTESAYSS